MVKHEYFCKKTGLTYTLESGENTVLDTPRDEYAWHKGANEYMDNYHASVTRRGKDPFVGTDEEFKKAVSELCDEAVTRWNANDVRAPGTRKSDPATKQAKELVAKIGTDSAKAIIELPPEKLAQLLAQINKQRAKAGQSHAA